MKLVIRDTVTGREVTVESDASEFWWADGNGSCDCNRASEFPDIDAEIDAAIRAQHPELPDHVGYCYGSRRFLIVECDDPCVDLANVNSTYPNELVSAHLSHQLTNAGPDTLATAAPKA